MPVERYGCGILRAEWTCWTLTPSDTLLLLASSCQSLVSDIVSSSEGCRRRSRLFEDLLGSTRPRSTTVSNGEGQSRLAQRPWTAGIRRVRRLGWHLIEADDLGT